MKPNSQTDFTPYHREQLEAWRQLVPLWNGLSVAERKMLKGWAGEYFVFREQTAHFLKRHFESLCNQNCYQNNTSACCSKDGIIIFFADLVNNLMVGKDEEIERLLTRLGQGAPDSKCIYLGDRGCLWQLKPIVCEMFLCDEAHRQVLASQPAVLAQWEALETRRKRFTWPDRRVLFDQLEAFFIRDGLTSTLMYLHNSPGLLRVKQRAGYDQGGDIYNTEDRWR